MIYCLTSIDSEGSTVYKIGFTTDLKARLSVYTTHNPNCKVIKVINGNKVDEMKIHNYLHLKGLSRYKREWYYDEKMIEEIFDQPLDDLDEYLWKNRSTAFTKSKCRCVDWFNLYKRLQRKYKKTGKRKTLKS